MSFIQTQTKQMKTSENPSRSHSIDSHSGARPLNSHQIHPISAESLSDTATLFFIRRTLCSQPGDKVRSVSATIDEILPPLTSSNEVDLQLYAFIAIIIREYIHKWYHKITPDQVFVEELIKIVAHCTRAIEQRLRRVDLESLLFDEIPELLETHIDAFQISHKPFHPLPLEQDSRHIYHSLWPLPALAPVPSDQDSLSVHYQAKNESAYRQLLVQGFLALMLPTEDLENDCLTSIFSQILSELVLGSGISEKASQPWLLWEGITKLAEVVKLHILRSQAQVRVEQSKSSSCDSDCDSGLLNHKSEKKIYTQIRQSLEKTFWLCLQYFFLMFMFVRFFITRFSTSISLPSRNRAFVTNLDLSEAYEKDQSHHLLKKPFLIMKVWSCSAKLVSLEMRMPWLKASLSMLQWAALTGPGKIGTTDGILDKILSHTIQTHVLAPTVLPNLLRTARATLFPNNMPAPLRHEPDAVELIAIRRRCAESILELLPKRVRDVYFGSDWEDMVREVEEGLCIFGDSYCNKHLLYSIVELILVRLMPELAKSGIEELLKERLN